MSGILRRTAFVDNSKGYPIYHNYCVVGTTLGPCVEFDTPFQRGDIGATRFTPDNEASKVDSVVSLSLGERPAIMKDEDRGIMLQEVGNYSVGV